MKKMNRSQSSYRNCKTLITEQDQQNCASKYASRHNASKNTSNIITNSFLDPNKQNSSLFQSVSQRHFHSKSRDDLSQVDPTLEELNRWKHKCRQYEHQIQKLYQEKDTNYQSCPNNTSIQSNNFANSKSYNYSEQFYLKQIEELKRRLKDSQKQLEYMNSKNEETQLNNSEISLKIQKDHKEKNVYIKELNVKQIEITNLQERVKLLKGENETLRMYLQQRGKRVQQLEQKLGQVDMRKKKIQNYQYRIKQANQFLKDVEIRTQKLKEQTQQKDQIIRQKAISISELQQTIGSYEDKLRSIEQALIRISDDKKDIAQKNEHIARQCIQWKQNYQQLLKKSQFIQEMQIKIKTYTSMIQDLNKRNMELTSANQKYRINCITLQKNLERYAQLDKQMNGLKKDSKQKQQKLNELQGRQKAFRNLEQSYSRLKKEKDEALLKWQQKSKEAKTLTHLNEDLLSKITNLTQQITEIQETNSRSKQRSEKMDILMKENNKLNTSLMQKINQIQKLQYRLNNLESKAANTAVEIVKQKGIIEQREQQIRQMEVQIDDIRNRYENQTNGRIQAEDKLVRASQQILALKFNCGKIQEEMEKVKGQIEIKDIKHDEEMEKIKMVLRQSEQDKREYESLLNESNKKIEMLRSQIEQCVKQIDQTNKKEKNHKISIQTLQVSLKQLLLQNSKLKEVNQQMFNNAQKIKLLSQNIMTMRSV